MISKIEKISLVDEAYDRIKRSILQEELKEGQPIPSEHQFCNLLNVSRVVVREALQRLRSERFIVTYQGKGSFVANPQNFSTPKQEIAEFDYSVFCDVMQLRSVIEYSAINFAVERASQEELQKIVDIAEQMAKANLDQEKFNTADYNFHLEIVKASHNKAFLKSMESVKREITFCFKCMNSILGSRDWAISLHKQIANKIFERDAKGAIDLLKNNGEYNIARMKELF